MNLPVVTSSNTRQAAQAACLVFLLSSCGSTTAPRPEPTGPAGPQTSFVLREVGTGLPRSGQWRNGFDLADLDGDGHVDIVHGPPRKGVRGPAVFLGDGHGTFRRWQELSLPSLPYDYGDAVAADLDGDGRPDLALAMHLRGLVALRNDGQGKFSPLGPGLPLGKPGSGFSSRAIEAVDWDGDGRTDLVAASEGPTRFGGSVVARSSGALGVFLNLGDRWERVPHPQPDPGFGDGLAVADVDGDGQPDAVTSAGGADGRSILHLNDGAGWRGVEVAELPPRASVGAVAAGDVDGDGRTDLAIGYLDPEGGVWHAAVDLLLGRPAGFERRELLREEGRTHVRAVVLADLDGDRRVEVIALRGDGALLVIPVGTPRPATVVAAPDWRRGCSGYGLRVGDLDHDGHPEIVASFAGETSVWDLDGGCTSGGGIQVWAVETATR